MKNAKHIYFIGIGGIGISALAKMMLHRGKDVNGVNDSESKETLDELRDNGVEIEQLADSDKETFEINKADVYVYSVAWESRAPYILEAARATGKPVLTYFEALGEIAKEYKTIAISGTHGKTTTTAMTAQVLIKAELDPTVIVGSLVDWKNGTRSNFRAGNSEYLVVEACEYKRHFLNFHPYILAVTNMELDHPDYYKDLADVEDAFAEVASQAEIVLSLESIEKYILRVPELKVLGEHNRKNAALALAIADELGIDLEKAKEALSQFNGTWRRLEYKGKTKNGAQVYDDYAHHPTAIRATLKALHEAQPDKKILAVFEPHMFSRLNVLFVDFGKAFQLADKVIIAPVYAAREKPIDGISSETLAQEISKYQKNVQSVQKLEDIDSLVNDNVNEEYIVLFMSAGDLHEVANRVVVDDDKA